MSPSVGSLESTFGAISNCSRVLGTDVTGMVPCVTVSGETESVTVGGAELTLCVLPATGKVDVVPLCNTKSEDIITGRCPTNLPTKV